ncbi:MAG: hypothetical protein IJ070_02995, partial [Firmicutes bacterium]|nr:hypothetical protein [Bacillota bacterium]
MNLIRNLWGKYRKFSGRYIVMLVVIAIVLDLIIETLARHSLIESAAFVFGHPAIALCNISLIFAVLSFALLFKKRVFAAAVLSFLWLALGITNGVILMNRMTPFTTKDLDNLKDGWSLISNYFSVKTLIFVIVAVFAVVFLGWFVHRKSPRMSQNPNYQKVIATIVISIALCVGLIQGGMRTGVLDTFFYSLPSAYADNGVPYCFSITAVKSGVDKPRDYSGDRITGFFKDGQMGSDRIYTPVKDDDTNVERKPNIIFLQL